MSAVATVPTTSGRSGVSLKGLFQVPVDRRFSFLLVSYGQGFVCPGLMRIEVIVAP
jgi:hypothetical protein